MWPNVWFPVCFQVFLINCRSIYADDTTLYFKCDQAADLWQQIELASELKSDLQDTMDWGRKWLVDFITGKSQLVPYDHQ